MFKQLLTAATASLVLTTGAQARDIEIAEDKVLVMGCLEQLEQTTTWGQCVQLMFAPCADEVVATDAHAACLSDIRDEWVGTVDVLQGTLLEAVTPKSRIEILDLLSQWNSYVDQRCTAVAADKQTGKLSARLGCEVSEIAGLSGEFAACLEGRSTAEYCEFKE